MSKKLILRCALAFAILIPSYVLIMALVIKLPVDARIAAHLHRAAEDQPSVGGNLNEKFSVYEQSNNRFYDMFSECIELSTNLGNTNQPLMRRVVLVPYITSDPTQPAGYGTTLPCKDLSDAVLTAPKAYVPYFRFWHGTSLYMRLVLSVAGLDTLRLLNAIILYGCVLAFSFKLKDWFGWCAVPLFLLPYALTSDLIMASLVTVHAISLACMYLTVAIFMTMLEKQRRMTDSIYLFVFISGSFFNFLSMLYTPELVPMLLAFMAMAAAYRWEPNKTPLKKITTAFAVTVTWFTGFALTWIAKWVLCLLVAGKAFVMEDVATAASGKNYVSFFYPAAKHLFGPTWYVLAYGPVGKLSVLALVLSWIIVAIFLSRIKDVAHRKQQLQNWLLLQAPCLIAITWFEVMRYHSMEHCLLARRASTFLVIAPLLALLLIRKDTTRTTISTTA